MQGIKKAVRTIEITFVVSEDEEQALLELVRNPQCDPSEEPEAAARVRRAIYETIVEGRASL